MTSTRTSLTPPALDTVKELLRGPDPGRTRLELKLTLVTPMFGGGVVAGEIDAAQPFRPSGIRGQLRFWWRATSGAQYSDATALLQAESEIWGHTDAASPVRIQVHKPDKEPAIPSIEPKYVFFSIKDKENAKHLIQGNFQLHLIYPADFEKTDEIQWALQAWLLFGGIGARTRRGCGTLRWAPELNFLPPLPSTQPNMTEWIRSNFSGLPGGGTREWPTLKGAKLLIGEPGSTLDVWKKLIATYSAFRQARPANRPPGRSYWPEPEAIRKITGQRLRKHEEFTADPLEFPRALLGLPIITHFKDEKAGDPQGTTLKLSDSERHASPLILKVLPISKTEAVPMALLLNTDIAQRINGKLMLKNYNHHFQTGPYASPLDIRPTARTKPANQRRTLREVLQQHLGHLGPEVTL